MFRLWLLFGVFDPLKSACIGSIDSKTDEPDSARQKPASDVVSDSLGPSGNRIDATPRTAYFGYYIFTAPEVC